MPKSKAKRQMKRLFEDGGLLQEGGTVDKESGNEVPTGSLKKEVRDDIPAQLSEGEFVFPADVVRFIGLQKLMELRQAAKEGLAKMESMGQMGNADEATEEDTGEFETELDDILDEIENESEGENEKVKKFKGGIAKFSAGGTVTKNIDPASVYQGYTKENLEDALFAGQNKYDPAAAARVSEAYQFLGVKPEDINYWLTLLQHHNQDVKLYERTPGSSQANVLDISKQNLKQFYLAKDIAKGNLNFRQAGDILRAYEAEQDINSINTRLKNEQSYLDAITKDPTKISGGMDVANTQKTINTLLQAKASSESRRSGIQDSLKNVDVSQLEFTKAITPTSFKFDNSGAYNETTQSYDPSDFSYLRDVPEWLSGSNINLATKNMLKDVNTSTPPTTTTPATITNTTTKSTAEQTQQTKTQQQPTITSTAAKKQANPFGVPFSVERYSKEGEKDIFMPTFGGQTQAAIPEGFQKSTKVQSFGGVFRKPEEAQQTVTSSLNIGRESKAASSTTATTTDLTKTTQPIPDAYKGLDTDITKEKYLIDLAENNAKQFTAENQTKGRAWGQGQVYSNPFANLTEFGTVKELDNEGVEFTRNKNAGDYIADAFPRAPDGKSIFDHESTFVKTYKRDASGNPKEVAITEVSLEDIKSGNVLFQVGGKTGGDNRERMAQAYQVVQDKLVPVGKASFYKGAHPDAELAMPIAMGAAFALAPFTGGASVAIGEAILGAGAVGAATLGSAVIGATVNGITAAATGGNVGKAMITGAVSGGIGANAMDITNAVLGPETVNSLSQATNLSAKQIASTFSSSISNGINTAIQGGDFSDIIKNFGQSLITSGVSEIAATNAMKTLSGTMDKQNLQRIGVATKMLTNVALNASLKGLDINTAIKYYAPTVMTRALTVPGGG